MRSSGDALGCWVIDCLDLCMIHDARDEYIYLLVIGKAL